MKEIWKPVIGFPYTISDQGQIKNIKTGKILKPYLIPNGYFMVALGKNIPRLKGSDGRFIKAIIPSRLTKCLVHRLVWQAFNGPIPNGLVINHISGVKTDNRLVNLEMVTKSQDAKHAFRLGLRKSPRIRGSALPFAKLTEADIPVIRQRIANGESQYSVARAYGVARGTIQSIVNGRSWHHVYDSGIIYPIEG